MKKKMKSKPQTRETKKSRKNTYNFASSAMTRPAAEITRKEIIMSRYELAHPRINPYNGLLRG